MRSSTCEQCGESFEHGEGARRFCSNSCKAKAQHAARKAAGLPGVRTKTGETVACVVCGKEFYRKAFQIKDGTGFCCSKPCKDAWQARNAVTRPCPWCGKEFTTSPSQAKRVRFCSWECQIEGRSKTAIDRWHNGRRVRKNDDGYLMVYQPDHPSAYKDGWMLEHRLVAEQTIGRALTPDEHVHHVNGVKDDNTPDNLAVLSPGEHVIITTAANVAKLRAQLAELESYRAKFGPLEGKE